MGIGWTAGPRLQQEDDSGSHYPAEVTDDWIELLVALRGHGARYLVVGAHALAIHGVPRATQDLDVWVDPEPHNADMVWRAVAEFGAPSDGLGISVDDLRRPDVVIQIGLPPNRIDLLTSRSGAPDFQTAWSERVERTMEGQTISFLGREALVATKRATGRHKDLGDLEALGETPS